ncbi:hypothetical protein FOQG_02101 [Fusarium oxysporum f. sp. raphani 54005]|uniref:Uncharacterized protein n=3 Tax=Fusarium oxysporum TaxID=5507 RepID=X0D0Q3_FUSOX|nr:hypothetical protein FOVG_07148 [Fusarium oxysporum f. sp. pisi HDV247]EXK96664.1 hypothetical protein FOQG_02101 [Fusarium oxysporum f. sp. raphani 54005]EXL82728.1 hypothetical protein FOPG_04539 [Fusarium oxysporum f. sp. conglutinans race 2 54008]
MDNSMREMRDFAQFAFPGRPIVVVEDSTPSAHERTVVWVAGPAAPVA